VGLRAAVSGQPLTLAGCSEAPSRRTAARWLSAVGCCCTSARQPSSSLPCHATLAPLTAGPPPLPVYHYDNCQLANGTTCGKCGFGCDHCGPPPPGARVTLDASRFHINGGSCQINDPDGPFYDAKHGVYHVFVRPPNAAPCDRLLLLAAAGCCCCCCWLLLAAGCWLLAAGCWLLAAAAMQSHD
jgi:hypothetical protein